MTSRTSTPPEQLTLLPEAELPLRFRLDEATRARGLRHVSAIRAQLERQALPTDTRSTPADRPTQLPIRPTPAHDRGRPAA